MNKISIRGILLHGGITIAAVFASVLSSLGQNESLSLRDGLPFNVDEAFGYSSALGSQECPFPDSSAVPDTLDPNLYYPMAVGNRWEYTVRAGPFFGDPYAEEITGTVVIEGIQFYRFLRTTFVYDVPVITRSRDATYYRAVVDSALAQWFSASGVIYSHEFGHDFNSCYESSGLLNGVGGGYGGTITVPEEGAEKTYPVAARKVIGNDFMAVWFYAHGIGPYLTLGDPDQTTELVYARIGGQELGTHLTALFPISIKVEDQTTDVRSAPELSVYPNPLGPWVILHVLLPTFSTVTVEIYDSLGRLAATPISQEVLPPGPSERTWIPSDVSPGVYFVKLFTGGRQLTRQMVKIQ